MATAKQITTIESLARQTGTDLTGRDLHGLSFEAASRWIAAGIEKAKSLPRPALAEVPEGRYAINREGSVWFVKVDRPTEGKWEGYTFVKRQAGEELWPIKDRASKAAVLATIAVDPQAAMVAYGREIGACGHCGRTLTNEASREAGIGPVCATKMGW